MEVSVVRNRLQRALEQSRERAQRRHEAAADAERAYHTFLQDIATPVVRQLANALKVEGFAFTVFTPSGGLRLAADRGRDDYIEFALDTTADSPQIVGRISHTRGSRTIDEERPVKAGAAPGLVTEEDVLTFLLDALKPWMER
jgi:hypothetical protein